MSEKIKSETFKEWYEGEDNTNQMTITYNKFTNAQMAWNHQQKKINALEKELELKHKWVKHHQREFEIVFARDNKMKRKIEKLEKENERLINYVNGVGINT